MSKKTKIAMGFIFLVFLGAIIFATRSGDVSFTSVYSWARDGAVTTLTQLPALPDISLWARTFKPRGEIAQAVVDVKLSTYPPKPSTSYRAGKHRTTGIFSSFEPREDQVIKIAPHYELFLLSALRANFVPTLKTHNPSAKVLMYIANSLTTVATLQDAGSIDKENTDWILKNHPDWLLKGSDGQPIQGTSWSPKYWPDPGNKEWQAFFVQKVNQALKSTGGRWDGILFDEFLSTHTGHTAPYVGSSGKQVKYTSDAAFRQAQLEFLRYVAPRLSVPILPNVDSPVLVPNTPAFNPEFFTEVQRIAGGAEAEVFVLHAPNPDGFLEKAMVEVYLDLARKTPPGKIMVLSSPTADLEGNIERTLYAYLTYLLVASPGRAVYWAFKEGESSVPHFWFKEFDLDLGPSQGEMQTVGTLWRREFANAAVVVNPNQEAATFAFKDTYFDTLGKPLTASVSVGPHRGVLLMKKQATVPKPPLLHEVK
ncbi:MAG TPA: putative glycoside hydrolase [Candidatus Binatia bacterium]